jgi:hypothetical protein
MHLHIHRDRLPVCRDIIAFEQFLSHGRSAAAIRPKSSPTRMTHPSRVDRDSSIVRFRFPVPGSRFLCGVVERHVVPLFDPLRCRLPRDHSPKALSMIRAGNGDSVTDNRRARSTLGPSYLDNCYRTPQSLFEQATAEFQAPYSVDTLYSPRYRQLPFACRRMCSVPRH